MVIERGERAALGCQGFGGLFFGARGANCLQLIVILGLVVALPGVAAAASEPVSSCLATIVVVAPESSLNDALQAVRDRLTPSVRATGVALEELDRRGGELREARRAARSAERSMLVTVEVVVPNVAARFGDDSLASLHLPSTAPRQLDRLESAVSSLCAGDADSGALELDYEETVVVTGSRVERSLMDVPYSISVIDEQRIEEVGADSPGELLRDVPGIQLTDTSLAGGKRIRIRGEVGSNVLVLVDGREISEQRSFHGAAPLLLDLADVERVEVVRGPSTVVYGSKAIGGTVNFISGRPPREEFAGRTTLTLNSATEGYDGGLSVAGTFPEFDYSVSFSRSEHDDRRVPEGSTENLAYEGADDRLENTAFDTRYLTAELGRTWGASRFSLRVEDYESSVESHTADEILSSLDGFQLTIPQQDRRTYSASYDRDDPDSIVSNVRVTAYRTTRERLFQQELGLSQPNFAGPGSLFELDLDLETVFEQTTTGILTSFATQPWRRHALTAGIDLVRDEMDATVVDTSTTSLLFPGAPFPMVTTEVESPRNDARQDSAGIFVQDEWSVTDSLTLVLGTRYNAFESSLRETTNENLETGTTSRGELSSAIAAVYRPRADRTYRASYSQGYRHPNLLELYEGTAHGGGGLLYPNPSLDPETSDNYELGFRLARGGLSLDASVYYTRATEYVTTRLCGGDAPCPDAAIAGTDRVYDNVNGAKTSGIEVFASYALPNAPVALFADASFLDREFSFATFTTDKTGLAPLWGRAGVRVERAPRGERLYFGELYVRAADAAEEEFASGEIERYPGWATLNLRVGAQLRTRVPLRVSLELANLFDKSYRPAQETLFQPGRHAIVKLVTEF